MQDSTSKQLTALQCSLATSSMASVYLHQDGAGDYLVGVDPNLKHAVGAWLRGLAFGVPEKKLFAILEEFFEGHTDEEFEDFCDDLTTIVSEADNPTFETTKRFIRHHDAFLRQSFDNVWYNVEAVVPNTIMLTLEGANDVP